MATPKFTDLASEISDNAEILEKFLTNAGDIPRPTFAPGGPLGFPAPPKAVEVHLVRERMIDTANKLIRLALGPVETLFTLATTSHEIACLHAIYSFDMASQVPLDGEASFGEIAKAVGLDEDRVCRIIRLATTSGIFKEVRPGFVSHTGASALLSMPAGPKDVVGSVIDDVFPATAKLVESLKKHPTPQKPMLETSFGLAHNTTEPFFDYLKKDPARSERFHAAMKASDAAGPFSGASLKSGYAWDELEAEVFVDVGGSLGHTALTIASGSNIPKFIVQDFNQDELARGEEALDEAYKGRFEFMQHDFFQPQPVKGADVYFFRFIFHDWPHEECVKILQATVPGLKKGARVMACDIVLPEPNETFDRLYRQMRVCDLHLLNLIGSRERSLAMWKNVFADADPRFRFVGVKPLPESVLSIVEAVWGGDEETAQ